MDKPYPNKPDTMSMKEYLTLKVSQEQQLPVATVRLIIENQFKTARTALDTPEINSIEIAGFGRFYFNTKRAHKGLYDYVRARAKYKKALLAKDITSTVKTNLLTRLISLDKVEASLKKKLNV